MEPAQGHVAGGHGHGKPETRAAVLTQGLQSGCCEPPRRAGAPRRWPQYPLGCTRFCRGRETYTRESSTHTLLLSPHLPVSILPAPAAHSPRLSPYCLGGVTRTHTRQEGPVLQLHQHISPSLAQAWAQEGSGDDTARVTAEAWRCRGRPWGETAWE